MATLQVAIYVDPKQRGREYVCPSIAKGIERLGDKPRLIYDNYNGEVDADVAVFYGFQPNVRKVMRDYVKAGKQAVHIDLGYWSRRHPVSGSRYGYHRFSINDHHPVAYFDKIKHPQDRADALGITLERWKNGGSYVLLCGMSEKAAGVVGFGYQEWERDAVNKIRNASLRPIIYRPKAIRGGVGYERVKGTTLEPPRVIRDSKGYPIVDILRALSEAWCVVSHHSNAGIDAIVSGVPCFQVDGVALPMGCADFRKIETPRVPSEDERRQWVNDVAYTQFNLDEMREGVPWKHFKDEGLIP